MMAVMLLAATGCNVGDGLWVESSDAAAKSIPDDGACHELDDATALAHDLTELINAKRAELVSLQQDEALASMAESYACQMIEEEFFGHEHPETKASFGDRVAKTDADFEVFGENLAAGLWTASEIVDAWLASETHRGVMLDSDFTHLGIAVRYGGHYGVYCVMVAAGQSGE